MLNDPTEAREDPVHRLPVVLVGDASASLGAASASAGLAGLTVVDGWKVPATPWDLTTARLVVVGVHGATQADSDLVDAVMRGAGAVIGVGAGRNLDARLLDALQRAAPVLDWRACPSMRLDAEQIRLLHALATGSSARAAARAIHVSERTAHRRIADARDALGAPSTNTAAAQIAEVVRSWTDRAVGTKSP